MSQPFAAGKHAFGFCDRCGFRYDLKELKSEVIDLNPTGYLVCPECWDPDNPQYQLGREPISGPEALENPRPDTAMQASRWGEGGSYEKNVWDFRESVEDWRSSNISPTSLNAVVWNEDSQTISVTQAQSGYMTIDFYKTAAGVGSYTSFDSSDFKVIRMRIKLASSNKNLGNLTPPWSGNAGRLYWSTATSASDNPFTGSNDYQTHNSEPDWDESMGDRFVTMKWDMKGHSYWTGNITAFRIYLYSNTDSSNYKSYEIDSIRVEEN